MPKNEIDIKILQGQKLKPRADLWTRIETSLAYRQAKSLRQKITNWIYSTIGAFAFSAVVLTGSSAYADYRLEQYLVSSLQPDYYIEALGAGTFSESIGI